MLGQTGAILKWQSGCLLIEIRKMKTKKACYYFFYLLLLSPVLEAQQIKSVDLDHQFQHPPQSVRPWVYWYWMQSAVSKEGITADLEAMKEAGIAGAYLMPIKGVPALPLYTPPAEQLSDYWWSLVRFAMEEAKRLGLQIAMHDCDGFAVAGGPWITPDMSMQKVVWSEKLVEGSGTYSGILPKPVFNEGYYKDIAVFAFPAPVGEGVTSDIIKPIVTTSLINTDASFLAEPLNKKNFSSNENCWIQYAFNQPFTCRSITIRTNSSNYQAHRLTFETSEDGIIFHTVKKLEAPRHGWQDTDEDYTYSVDPVSAKYFRFVYDKNGSEPGGEDLDAAKWKPVLKLCGIRLNAASRINQYEGKNGSVWRIAEKTSISEVADSVCIPLAAVQNITSYMDSTGKLQWNVPAGNWVILRIGHTSTGHTNATGGMGKGLECDKFNTDIVKLQYHKWYGEIIRHIGPELSNEVLKGFHIDSWECGSQNWSAVFQQEFEKRRGYSLTNWLPVFAGFPVNSAKESESVLYDIRQTISELISDHFFKTMHTLAHADGKVFTAESIAPVITSDGMLHYADVDVPMGEFWLRSPTHDKPNDILDAISGAHIYGKRFIQAEAFTELKMAWDEYPGMLKSLLDRNFTLGINRIVYHVFVHNPWVNKQPGMTLDGVGLFFQRDQTWWKQSRAFIDYTARCQLLLQFGKPVTDIAVFNGEEIPSRAILPYRFVNTLPGIFGDSAVRKEQQRVVNQGQPLRVFPEGVTSSANTIGWSNWINPLHGYQYDAINKDALLRLAKVEKGRIVLPGGASYRVLVIPATNNMVPDKNAVSAELAVCLEKLVKQGATIIAGVKPAHSLSWHDLKKNDSLVAAVGNRLWTNHAYQGKIVQAPYEAATFDRLGLPRDIIIKDNLNQEDANEIAFTHRKDSLCDIYFLSNQSAVKKELQLSLRVSGRIPELWDPVSGNITAVSNWNMVQDRTVLTISLEANGSVFVVLRKPALVSSRHSVPQTLKKVEEIDGNWTLQFDSLKGGPSQPVNYKQLQSWSVSEDAAIRYYSGTVVYSNSFTWKDAVTVNKPVYIFFDSVYNIATVKLNGKDCGIIWTYPFRADISQALKAGKNKLEVEVANTWANRIIGDGLLPEKKRISFTTSPIKLTGKPLLPAGITGKVTLWK